MSEQSVKELKAELEKATVIAETARKKHASAHAEVLRLANELRKLDPTWGSPMILNSQRIGGQIT